ncbi:TetR family transcriptional regulator [Fontibacillus phaseoli]|uniref:TetR family transcriptional regulator n=2 Tax=Fontibacillus phaseoli TaxID=1416533 RepID=A0A369BTN4_9BACL|nr:TetR family transcriptional regulator [Fontibacillus phaseoli]
MPKVPKGYEEKMRNMILDAAQEVCKTKPAYEVTMRDIIRQTKLSVGSVYRYFEDIDDILIGLTNRNQDQYQLWANCEPLFSEDKSVREVILKVFHYLGEYLIESIPTEGKFTFEMNTKFLANPELFNKKKSKIAEVTDFEKLMQYAMAYLAGKVEDGTLNPIMPLPDIFSFAVASMDGIVRDLVLFKCYSLPGEDPGVSLDEISLTNALARSLLFLLGEGN